MQQRDELTKVKARIKALTDKTVENGCSEHEALQAAEKVGQLLEQYNLSMSEIEIREEKCVHVVIPTGAKKRTPIDNTIMAIASFCDVKTWFSPRAAGSSYNFFGLEPDVQLAQYLYRVIASALNAEAEAFKRTPTYVHSSMRRSATHSFKLGMATRISHRLGDMKRERAMVRTTGTALVLLKGQLVEEEFKEQLGIKLRTTIRKQGYRHPDAYSHGAAAGDRVNLSRPLGSNDGQVCGLLS